MRRKILLAIAALPVVLVLVALLYLGFADLSVYRDDLERAASKALGRELAIGGEFDLQLSLSPRVVAGQVSLANPAWSNEPSIVYVERIDLTLSLWSLLSGPVRVRDVKIRGARVVLERGASGGANWEFDVGGGDEDPGGSPEVPIIFENARLEEAELVYLDPAREHPLHARFDLLELRDAGQNRLDVRIAGRYENLPYDLSGQASPLERLFAWKELQAKLAGSAGEGELSIDATFSDLLELADPELTIDLHGDDVERTAAVLGLTATGSGPFRALGRTTPTADGVELMLDVDLGGLTADIHGTVQSLLRPDTLDLTVQAHGPDLATTASVLGLEGLPAGPFDLSGRLSWDGERFDCEKLEAHVGESALTADGVIGMPPDFPHTDIEFVLSVPEPAVFERLVGIELPDEPLHAEGRFLPSESGVELQRLTVRLGESAMRAEGVLGRLPSMGGTDLEVHGEGPDLSVFDELAGVPLPALAFGIDGGLTWDREGLGLDGVTARLGPNSASASGRIAGLTRLVGSDLRLHLEGPDMASAGTLANLAGLPAEPFEIQGGLRVTKRGYDLRQATARVGRNNLALDGLIVAAPDLVGTEGTLRLSGPDLTVITTLFGLEELPRDAFDVAGGLRIENGVYQLKEVAGTVSGVALRVDGGITTAPGLDGTELRIEGNGPDLAVLNRYLLEAQVPGGAFSVSGALRITEGRYALDQVAGTLDDNRFAVDGTLGPFPGAERTDLTLDLSGPDLAAAGKRAADAGVKKLPDLPVESFSLNGRISMHEEGYAMEDLDISIGRMRANLDGILGRPPQFNGTRIEIAARGADAAPLATMTGLSLPAGPFQTRGVFQLSELGARFDGLVIDLGEYHVELDGTLGPPPRMVGTNLDLNARGPGLGLIENFTTLPSVLPDEAFEIKGHLDGTTDRFSLSEFDARLGKSDLSGSFRLDLRDKPSLQGRFISDVFDAAAFMKWKAAEIEESIGNQAPAEEGKDKKRVISDEPLDLESMRSMDADLTWSAKKIVFNRGALGNAEVGLRLSDGALRLDPFYVDTQSGGDIRGTFELGPAPNGYRVTTRLEGRNWRFDVTGAGIQSEQRPLTHIEIEFEGEGLSPSQLAAGANGRLLVTQNEGLIDSGLFDLLGAGLFTQLFEALSPYRERNEHTELECSVLSIGIVDGRATLDPLALRTSKTTVVGNGRINLATEKITLEWTAKPRKGIGLSASTITNPYIRVGGTLADPSVEIKPVESVVSTGAAVATVGLSILGRGLWERATAERKVCENALKEIKKKEKQEAGEN